MVDALISYVLEELATVIKEKIAAKINIVASVEDDIEKLQITFKVIQVVLKDAEQRKVRDELVRIWLDELTTVAKDMKCVLSEWSDEIDRLQQIDNGVDHRDQSANNKVMKKVRNLSYFCFVCFGFKKAVKRLDIGTKIKDIRERLDLIASEKDKYRLIEIKTDNEAPQCVISSSMVDVFEICGRNEEKKIIVNKLLSIIDHDDQLVTRIASLHLPDVISIVGMEGLGKTTLAQLVFNDELVQAHFEITVWICVSNFFDLTKVAKAILEEVGLNIHNSFTWNALQRLLRDTFKGKRFLLVFDDVCSDDRAKWEPLMLPFKYGAQESRILITTRNQRVAVMMNSIYIHSLEKLSDDECWLLIYRMSSHGKKEDEIELLKEISTEIAKKCNGLPLVALTIGRHLRFKDRHEWHRLLECDIWDLEEIDLKDLKPDQGGNVC